MRTEFGFVCLLLATACPAPSSEDAVGGEAGTTGLRATSSGESGLEAEASSSSGSGSVSSCAPTAASVLADVFEPRCALGGCHDAASAAAGLDLASQSPEALVGRASSSCDGAILVVPGDPSASHVIAKLGQTPGCGGTMPPGQPLPAQEIACLEGWIEQAEMSCPTCGTEACIDTTSNAMHCGGCDLPCPVGVSCVEGACSCPRGTQLCGDACVDTVSNPAHCGGCDMPCGEGLVCLLGACADGCGELTECSGACVDTDVSPLHCGGCDAPCGSSESCSAGECGCDALATSYAADVEPIFTASCATMGCHRPMGPLGGAEGLDLSAGSGYGALVDVPSTQCGDRALVAPGSPAQSYLVDKLRGVNLCSGTMMPKTGSIPQAQIQAVEDWICSGAAP